MSKENGRAIKVAKPVKALLVELRLLEEVIGPATVPQQALEQVEKSLECSIPDDLLATIVSGCDELRASVGLSLEKIPALTREAAEQGCPRELFVFGKDPEAEIYYCLPRTKGSDLSVTTFEVEERKSSRLPFVDWLARIVESRRDALAERDEESYDPADYEVGPTDLADFMPRVVAPPAASGRQAKHPVFGVGDIVRDIGSGDNRKIEIRFASGTKVLVARAVEEL